MLRYIVRSGRAGRLGAILLVLCCTCTPSCQQGNEFTGDAGSWANPESSSSEEGDRGPPIHMPAPTCDLCADNWLFVVSAGVGVHTNRLMAVLNGLPGFEIAAEHWGFLYAQATAHEELSKLNEMGGASWKHHPADTTNVMCTVQRSMKRVLYGRDAQHVVSSTKVIGVLEFQSPTIRLLRFLSRAFPCARYVFAYRNDAAIREQWIPDLGQWETHMRMFQALVSAFPSTMSMLAVDHASLREYNTIVHRLLGVRGCVYTSLPLDVENDVFHDPHAMRAQDLLVGRCDLSHIKFRKTDADLVAQEDTWRGIWEDWHRSTVSTTSLANNSMIEL